MRPSSRAASILHGSPVPLDDDGGAAVELRDEAPWLGLGRRLAGPVVAGLLDLERGAVVPRTCSCPACVEAERELQALMKRDIRQETEAMLRHVRALRRVTWQAWQAAHERAPAAVVDALALACGRLVDECGVPLADAVRLRTLHDFHGSVGWPWCALGQHPAGCGCPDALDGGDE